MQVRCDVCEKTTDGIRPGDCERLVRFTCVGPVVPPELTEIRRQIYQLQTAAASMETDLLQKKRKCQESVTKSNPVANVAVSNYKRCLGCPQTCFECCL